jgi:4-hydroxy-tetrahydrodipicolinate reductase
MVKVALIGAGGRMGQEIISLIAEDANMELAAAVEYKGSPLVGKELGGVRVIDSVDAIAGANVVVDFSGAVGTAANIEAYRKLGLSLVVGSTGLSPEEQEKLLSLQNDIPLFVSSNMSLGVNLMAKLVNLAAKVLDSDFGIEIFEAHHKHKKDAPSGTALTLAAAAAEGRGLDLEKAAVFSREGFTGERRPDEIGFQVLRGGDTVGEHTVFFCGEGERLEITHRATSRSILASGAVKAAKWMAGKEKGLYGMSEMLGL